MTYQIRVNKSIMFTMHKNNYILSEGLAARVFSEHLTCWTCLRLAPGSLKQKPPIILNLPYFLPFCLFPSFLHKNYFEGFIFPLDLQLLLSKDNLWSLVVPVAAVIRGVSEKDFPTTKQQLIHTSPH